MKKGQHDKSNQTSLDKYIHTQTYLLEQGDQVALTEAEKLEWKDQLHHPLLAVKGHRKTTQTYHNYR